LALVELTYMIRTTAEDNVHQNTALVMAQGYLEQLCRLPYSNPTNNPAGVVNIADDPAGPSGTNIPANTTVPITLISASGGLATNKAGGNFGNGCTSEDIIYLDQDTNGAPTFKMTFDFTPVLRDLNTTPGSVGTASGVEITVNFTATYILGTVHTFSGSLRTVRSNVPTM